MPHALHSTGLPLGPLRHWGLDATPQWLQGPWFSARARRRACCCASEDEAGGRGRGVAAAAAPDENTPPPGLVDGTGLRAALARAGVLAPLAAVS